MTKQMVLKIRKVIAIKELIGFTRVAMLGRIGVLRVREVLDEL